MKILRKVALLATVAMLAIFCATPPLSTAYIPEQKMNPIEKKEGPLYLQEDKVLASAYFTPKRSDYKSEAAYRRAVYVNGTGITHFDHKADIGTLAADLKYYPQGTKMRIVIGEKDYGIWTVDDIGPDIKHKKRHVKARDEDGELKKVTLTPRLDMHVGIGKKAGRLANKLGLFVVRIYVLEWGKRS